MHGLIADLRIGARMLKKRAGTTTLAIVALGLGIGLTTTMFSIVDGAILRGLPFDESDRILSIQRKNPTLGNRTFDVSSHDFLDYRDRQRSFSDFAAFTGTQVILSGQDINADRYRGSRITASTLRLLRIAPAQGRDFIAADEQPGAPAVMIVSDRIWETQFQRNPSAVGRVFRVNGVPTEIVGIMPPRFGFPETDDVWLPLQVKPGPKRGEGQSFDVIGRLKPGVSKSQASADMAAVAAQLAAEHPENKNITTDVRGFIEGVFGGEVIATLLTMLGAVFGVLLIACANVTNLQLARGLERSREIAIRTAIGADRWRVVRQLIVEGLLLATGGAVVGILIAWAGVSLFNVGIADTSPPFWIDIRLDLTVLGFVAVLTVTAALLSSVVPALKVTRSGTGDVLKDQGRGTTSLRTSVLSRVLVCGAVTLSCALLLVSGLMIKSVVQMGHISYAFASDDILMARTTVADQKYPTDTDVAELTRRLEDELSGIVGVRRATVASGEPGNGATYYLTKEGQTFEKPEDQPVVRRLAASASYFDVLRLKATAGRVLTGQDRAGTENVVVLTQDLVDRYFEKQVPIGQRIRLGRNPALPWWTVVGVIPTFVSARQGDAIAETAIVPFAQAPQRDLTLLLAAGATPGNAASAVRTVVKGIDQDLPVFALEPMATLLHRRGWAFRVFGTLFMTFGASALIMAAAGLYGVLAFGVRLRTQEIGVRMALGAARGQVISMILRQGMFVVGIGLALGLTIGYFVGPLMRELFFNVEPTDPTVFGSTAAVLLVTGLVASLVPARRAASVDPMVALRQD